MHQNFPQQGISSYEASNEISIGWKKLQYEVIEFSNFAFKKKPLLRGINGNFKRATLNGLLGPSGAGKTTLLNSLCDSELTGLCGESKIYANIPSQSQVLSCFIEQHVDEIVVSKMSVRDILLYAFKLKNSTSRTTPTSMKQHIQRIMSLLMLPSELLGQYFQDCSGGQQKRIAIGQELMSLEMPAFLFVDEPTTGLDSVSAFEVMNCLKQLTFKNGVTVIVSIHAPNNEILSLFDQIYVLAKGGVAIYSGQPCAVESYLKREIQLDIPARQPPIEALIRIACNGITDPNVIKLADKCSTSELDYLAAAIQEPKVKDKLKPTGIPTTRKRFSFQDLFYNFKRQLQITFVENVNVFLFTNIAALSLLCFVVTFFEDKMAHPSGCISLNQNENLTNLSQNTANCLVELNETILMRENIIFLWISFMFNGYFTICLCALFVSPFLKHFQNEHRNNWYSFGVFYLSIILTSLLEISIYSIIMGVPSYLLTHQHAVDGAEFNWHRFCWYLGIAWLTNIYLQSIGQLIGTILAKHMEVSVTLSVVVASILVVFNPMFYDLENSENFLLIKMSDLVGVKFLVKAAVYGLYGFGRCAEGKISNTLIIFHVNPDDVVQNLFLVCLNIATIRLATFVFMYYKFSNLHQMIWFVERISNWQKSNENHGKQKRLIDNFFGEFSSKNEMHFNKHQTLHAKSPNSDAEMLRNKIIIEWTELSLYKNDSLRDYLFVNSVRNRTDAILHNLNGHLRFGSLSGLMGCSGSGKTTLLKVLNGQFKTRLSLNSRFYLSKFVAIKACFIAQNVSLHLMNGLTAKQLLIYASKLKNVATKMNHSANALSLLEELDMSDIADTMVDNCSGGERKRLAIALELIAVQMPNLICIDEPTSGLDSNTAEMVISCLKKLCTNHNISIVCSIHQPNVDVLSMLDHLYVLSLDGVCIYSDSLLKIGKSLNKIPEIGSVDCRFALETLIKHACLSSTESKIVQHLSEQNEIQFSQNCDSHFEVTFVQDGVMRNTSRFCISSVKVLLQRYVSYICGTHWKELLFYICLYILFALSYRLIFDPKIAEPSGCIHYEEDVSSVCGPSLEKLQQFETLLNNYKYTFLVSCAFLFVMFLQMSMTIQQDLHYFWTEHTNGWYSTGSFYLSKRICEISLALPLIMIHVHICNFYEEILPGIYWNFVLILLLASLSIQALAHICALVSRGNFFITIVIAVVVLSIFMLLSNVFVHLHKMNYVYRFMANFSIVRFTFEASILLQYGFGRCGPREIQPFLYLLQIEDSDYHHSLVMLIVNIVVYQVIAVWLLVSNANPPQNRRKRIEKITNFNCKLNPSIAIIPGLSFEQFIL